MANPENDIDMLSGSEGLSDSEKVLKLQQLIRKLTDEQKQSKAKTAEELEEELKMKRMNLMMEETRTGLIEAHELIKEFNGIDMQATELRELLMDFRIKLEGLVKFRASEKYMPHYGAHDAKIIDDFIKSCEVQPVIKPVQVVEAEKATRVKAASEKKLQAKRGGRGGGRAGGSGGRGGGNNTYGGYKKFKSE